MLDLFIKLFSTMSEKYGVAKTGCAFLVLGTVLICGLITAFIQDPVGMWNQFTQPQMGVQSVSTPFPWNILAIGVLIGIALSLLVDIIYYKFKETK
jgi:hypothetical protein